eukprot:c8074_g1_i5.p1 GENE.c8074_g1_i5~~c8074_g1_i5.p1  ORF type:complete len:376 (+),score=92.13 c8074_g1_i5:35-1162(+)
MGQVDAVSFSIGVALCALSALCSVLGVNIQKKSHMKNEKLPPEKRQPYVKSPLWWMGMAGVVLGAIFDFASLGFAPQTVVAAFGSATLVINSWTAPFLLGESLERIELAVTFLITCGATMVVMNASHTSKSESLDVIIDRMKESRFIGYMIVIILGCIILGVCFRISEANKKFLTAPENNNKPRKKYSRRLHVVSITALSGVMGAQSLLFAKAVMLILRQSFQSGKASLFAKFETYVILGAMLTCVFGQTHALNAALARFDAVLVLPSTPIRNTQTPHKLIEPFSTPFSMPPPTPCVPVFSPPPTPTLRFPLLELPFEMGTDSNDSFERGGAPSQLVDANNMSALASLGSFPSSEDVMSHFGESVIPSENTMPAP